MCGECGCVLVCVWRALSSPVDLAGRGKVLLWAVRGSLSILKGCNGLIANNSIIGSMGKLNLK